MAYYLKAIAGLQLPAKKTFDMKVPGAHQHRACTFHTNPLSQPSPFFIISGGLGFPGILWNAQSEHSWLSYVTQPLITAIRGTQQCDCSDSRARRKFIKWRKWSSDCYNVSSSELSTSSKSSGEESVSKQAKVKGDVSTPKNLQLGKRQKKDKSLDAKDIEDFKT